jgi:hypothetical protein
MLTITKLIKKSVVGFLNIDPKCVEVRKGCHSEQIYSLRGRSYGDPRTRFYIKVTPRDDFKEREYSIGFFKTMKRNQYAGEFTLDIEDFEMKFLERESNQQERINDIPERNAA